MNGLLPLAVPQIVPCRRCGADLNGKLRRDTPAGPECAVPCAPKSYQLFLETGPRLKPTASPTTPSA